MKKLMLSSLLAILTLAASAQTNTYAMVIEMQNGTKLTIGPNEVKNVTFNNGQLTVTGETIETLVGSAVDQAKAYTDQAAANLKGYIDLATALEQVKGSISALSATVEGNKAQAIQAGKDAAAAAKEAAQNYALDQIQKQAMLDNNAWGAYTDAAIAALVKTYNLNAMSEIISNAGYKAQQSAMDYSDAQDAAQRTFIMDAIKMQADQDKMAWNAAINVAVENIVKTYQLNAMSEIISSRINEAIVNLIQTYNLQKQ